MTPKPEPAVHPALPDPKDLDDAMMSACDWLCRNAEIVNNRIKSVCPIETEACALRSSFGYADISANRMGMYSNTRFHIKTLGTDSGMWVYASYPLTAPGEVYKTVMTVSFDTGGLGGSFGVCKAIYEDDVRTSFMWDPNETSPVASALMADETVKLVLCGKLLALRSQVEASGKAAEALLGAQIAKKRDIILGTARREP